MTIAACIGSASRPGRTVAVLAWWRNRRPLRGAVTVANGRDCQSKGGDGGSGFHNLARVESLVHEHGHSPIGNDEWMKMGFITDYHSAFDHPQHLRPKQSFPQPWRAPDGNGTMPLSRPVRLMSTMSYSQSATAGRDQLGRLEPPGGAPRHSAGVCSVGRVSFVPGFNALPQAALVRKGVTH